MPPHIVQAIVGHAELQVTMAVFAHASLKDHRKALEQLEEMVAGEARFWLDLTNPDVRAMTVDGVSVVFRSDGSWARLAEGLVVQGGSGSVWDDVEVAHDDWLAAGRPSREQYRMRITDAGQDVFLVGRPGPMYRLRPLPG